MTGDAPLVRRLRDVVDLIGADLDRDSLVAHLSQSTLELFGAQGACWCELEGDRLRIVTAAGLSSELVGLTYPLEGSAVGRLLSRGERSLVDRAACFPHLNDRIYQGPDDKVAVALSRVDADLTGALYVTLLPEHPFAADELEVLELLASHVAMALHHVQLYGAAEQARQEQAAVVAAMADGVAVVDAGGAVRSWNASMERLTGRSADRALGRPLPFPLPAPGEVLSARPAGRWLDVVGSPPGPRGERVVSARDVTAAKELEHAQEVFLATTSHELRTPLTVLRGFGDTLLRHWDALDDERRRDLVERMLSRTAEMTLLVEQVLQASTAELVASSEPLVEVDLAAEVAHAVRAVAGASEQHPVVLDAPSPVPVRARPGSVRAVLDQLVENAVKYSPAGGPVEVAVRAEGEHGVLTVADRGRGIDPAEAPRVFDRFYRAGGAGAGPGGVGLGLWIVRRTVEAQGGDVALRPREGGGTVAVVRLRAP